MPVTTTMSETVEKRAQAIAALSNTTEWDIVVIGGGATGLGTALDAAARGYRVLLLEQADFAKSTSSKSTKLVHGGVRYLAQGNVGLVREASIERGLRPPDKSVFQKQTLRLFDFRKKSIG